MSEIKPRSVEPSQLTPLRVTSLLLFRRWSLVVFFSVSIILTLSKSDVDPPASSNGRLRMPLFPALFSDIFPYGTTFPALFPRSHQSLTLQLYFLLLHRQNGSEWMFKNSGPQSNTKISSLNTLRTISLSAFPTCYPQCHIPHFVTVIVVLVSLNIHKKHRIKPSYREWCCNDKYLNSYSWISWFQYCWVMCNLD